VIKIRKSTDIHRTELDPQHVARLHEIPLKQDRTHYACQVLHQRNPAGVSTAAVMAWLSTYGYGENDPHGQKRNRVSPVVAAYRRQHNLDATGSAMPPTTPAGTFLMPPALNEGVVVQFPSVGTPGLHPTGQPSTAQSPSTMRPQASERTPSQTDRSPNRTRPALGRTPQRPRRCRAEASLTGHRNPQVSTLATRPAPSRRDPRSPLPRRDGPTRSPPMTTSSTGRRLPRRRYRRRRVRCSTGHRHRRAGSRRVPASATGPAGVRTRGASSTDRASRCLRSGSTRRTSRRGRGQGAVSISPVR
jgi:hypothetical protein